VHEVVLSLEKLNKIEEIDTESRTITVQAGVVLEEVHLAATKEGLLFPLSFGAKGTAQVGGVLSTNAGGLRVFKYGMTRHLVLGVEAVLADGTVISSMKKIIKDNSGYDLKQLFLGSEGTLGVITRAVLKLVEAPRSRTSAFVSLDSYDNVIRLLKYMDAGLAGILSGYELIWERCYKAMTSPPALQKPPIPYGNRYYVLLETLGSDQSRDQERLEHLLQLAMEQDMIMDAVPAYAKADLDWFWTIREDVHAFISQYKHQQHFDISLPIPLIERVVDAILIRLDNVQGVKETFVFGHIADGNIHMLIAKENSSDDLRKEINEIIYQPLRDIGGSVSAEHGIGVHKKDYLAISRSAQEIQLMKQLKLALDTKNILNRGKIFDL